MRNCCARGRPVLIKTPEHLQREFQIPEHAGRPRAISRYWFAYQGPKKSELLSTIFALTLAGATLEHRKPRKFRTPVTQDELAGMCGLKSRSTFTRRVGLFRPRTQEDTDLESSGRRKRRRDPKAQLLDRSRRFAEPNIYTLLLPEGPKDQDDPEAYIAPTLADLLEDPRVSSFFDPSQLKAGKNGRRAKNSFKKIAGWLWNKHLPLSNNARLVMTYYFSLGLGERHSTSKELTYTVRPKQTTVARACGLSVRTVYAANLELARVKLIRVVQQKPKMVNGKFRRGPAKILYLPMRTLTHEECRAEAERLYAAKGRLQDPTWWDKAVGIHTRLLHAWNGQEHCITALHHEFARQLKAEGAPKRVTAALLPRPPE